MSNSKRNLFFAFFALICLTAVAEPTMAAMPENRVVVRERAGVDYVGLGGYPWQIGRPFAQGEIVGEPDVLADGIPVPVQQASVKTRWPDGSVKFAVIQARLPLKASRSLTITFQSRAPRAATGLTLAEMLAADFDAEIRLTSGGVTKSAFARQMLAAGHYQVWTAGPAATTVIIGDHSAARTYDIGFTAYRPFRPLFHATFWPGWGVEVRAIGEIANTLELQDVTADVQVILGASKRTTIVNEAAVLMPIKTRWSRRGWITREPGRIDHDYNLAYLAAVKAVPNYDTSLQVPESRLASLYATYQGLAKNLYAQTNAGNWHKPMSDVGGRPDLGPFPMWYVVWLYSGDGRMAEYCNFLSEQYGAVVNGHLREGKPGRKFHGDTDAVGRVISINARPTISVWHEQTVATADKLTFIAPFTKSSGIGYEAEHVPHPYPIPYLLTGEFYMLEQLWFAASMEMAHITATLRGPTGDRGGFYFGSPRSTAWQSVARFEAAYFSPDGSPEQAYFRAKSLDTVQAFDGLLNVPGTPYTPADAVYNYWRTTNYDGAGGLWRNFPPGTQGFWGPGAVYEGGGIDFTVTQTVTSLWMQGFIVYTLGRAQDLGFDTSRAIDYVVRPFLDIVTESPNPSAVGKYRYPVRRVSDGNYFPSHAESFKGLLPSVQTNTTLNVTDFEHSYDLIALTAASFGIGRPNGPEAWSWYSSKVRDAAISKGWATNPKWAIMPRTAQSLNFPAAPRNLRVQ